MSFLAPLFILGALAVAGPIVFHLIRRTSRDKVPFSSLMFLLPTPPRVTRRSRLENIWLLVLRCLVLCLLALGFARPFFLKPLAADPQSGIGKKIVLLLDTSASMRRDNLWPEARAIANRILRKASPADQIALCTFDRQVRTLVSFEQWTQMSPGERSTLSVQRLEEVSPGWAATHLGNAIISAAEAFSESGLVKEGGGLRQIILISDFQEGSRLEGLQGFEWPKGIEVVLEPVKAKRPTNAGIQLVMDRDGLDNKAGGGDRIRIRVSNSPDSRREQFQIGWGHAGEKAFIGTAEETLGIYVPPGQSRVVPVPKVPAGLMDERLVLVGDDEDFDNTVYVVPAKAEQIVVLYLGNDSEKDPTQSLYFLKRAFQQTRRQIVQVNSRPPGAPLLAGDTVAASLMIVADSLPEEQTRGVRNFLNDGKTILLVMKNTATVETLARLLDKNNLATEEAVSGYAMLGQIDFEHPLFAPFADPRYSDFTKIHFWKHRRLKTNDLGNAQILARFDNGDPAFLQISVGKGTVVALTSGWHPADSQLALSSKFVPLLYSILEQSGAIKAQTAQYSVGDAVTLTSTGATQQLRIRKPDGAEADWAAQDQFTKTELPGIYTVTTVQPSISFAVNIAPDESKTAPLALEELARLGLPLKQQPASKPKESEKKRAYLQATELEQRQKLWRWLIVAALVVLLMETWLAGRLTRRAVAAVPALP